MKANPGGTVSPENCIGRDPFIAELWKVLDRQSVVLVAERRSGKTTILQKMTEQQSATDVVIFRDVGGISQPLEFAQNVSKDVEKYLSTRKKIVKQTHTLLQKLAGTKLPGVQLPPAVVPDWKSLLTSSLADLAASKAKNVVLLWDELPWMLQKIIKNHNDVVAVDLLDTLRGLRQMYPNLRMIYNGSIGLHHVTSALRNEGYSNSPVNDMQVIEVPPLALADALILVKELLKGEQISCNDQQEVSKRIADLTDGVPYYIHHVVAKLADLAVEVSVIDVDTILAQALVAAHDPWNLAHYRQRLKGYYAGSASIVQRILDLFAEYGPLTLPQLQQKLQLVLRPSGDLERAIVEGDSAALKELLSLLKRDHYLIQNAKTAVYQFQFSLISRWWRLELGLV